MNDLDRSLAVALRDGDVLQVLLHMEIVEDINHRFALPLSPHGQTMLMLAVSYNMPHVMQIVIDRGADPNLQDGNGWTALRYAAHKADHTYIDLLIEAGADVNICANDKRAPCTMLAHRVIIQ